MCGIAGFIALTPQPACVIAKMTNLIRHRGPDDEGFVLFKSPNVEPLVLGGADTPPAVYTQGLIYSPSQPIDALAHVPITMAFGHRRLSIVDLSPFGHQPMCTSDQRYWIVYNGEVYNHVELRKELEVLGHHFVSQSDTEVILAAYAQWGVDCLHRFNGMWAFVIYDTLQREVFIARDRFGVKPLYYWYNGDIFAFASEIKVFLTNSRFEPEPNINYLREYLGHGPREYLAETAFNGVFRIGASSYVLAKAEKLISGDFHRVQWWGLEPVDTPVRFSNDMAQRYADEYYELLRDAVQLRLRADVTVGSALSGGIDSTSVVYLVSSFLKNLPEKQQQETFSSVYRMPGTEDCDESTFIRQVGEQLNVYMNMIEPMPMAVPVEHAKMIWHMDTPPESTCMSGWHTFKLVDSRGIKVTLDGQGADEQLAGYLSSLAIAQGMAGLRSILELRYLLAIHPARVAFGATGLGLVARLASHPFIYSHVKGRRGVVLRQLGSGLNAALAEDCFSGLLNLIHYADRTSMAFGIESRMPFLDFRLAEFLAKVPCAYKIHHGWTKYIARLAFASRLPETIVWRKDKMGWPIPEKAWEQGMLSNWFKRPRAAVCKMADLGIGKEFNRALNAGSITQRVRALNLDVWYRTFIEGGWRPFQ